MIPVAVRQHDGLDLAEVDAENGRILRQRRAGRTGVEQQRVSLALDVRGEEQRQAVVRATDHLAREHRQPPGRVETRPLGHHELRRGREAVGRVVHQDEHLEAIDRPHQAPTWAMAARTRAGVSGKAVSASGPGASASHTALAMAAPRPGLPHSPRPRRPSGLVFARIS